jgi:DNA-binding transcriptional LysR family regulator
MAIITLRQLEIFTQTVEAGSFSRCAEHIGISQVAISGHIKELESRLGVVLFDRPSGGPAVLTLDGERAYYRARNILSSVDGLIDEARLRSEANTRRKITVGAHSYCIGLMQSGLAQWADVHPDIEIVFDAESFTAAAVADTMKSNRLDLAFIFALGPSPRISSEFVCNESLSVFVGQDHPLAAQNIVTARDLSLVPAIRLSPADQLGLLVEQAMEMVGICPPSGLQTDNFGLILSSIRQNVGFSCMFTKVGDQETAPGGLKRLPLDCGIPAVQIRQIVRPALCDDPLVRDLQHLLVDSLLRT